MLLSVGVVESEERGRMLTYRDRSTSSVLLSGGAKSTGTSVFLFPIVYLAVTIDPTWSLVSLLRLTISFCKRDQRSIDHAASRHPYSLRDLNESLMDGSELASINHEFMYDSQERIMYRSIHDT